MAVRLALLAVAAQVEVDGWDHGKSVALLVNVVPAEG
jgi:hypothetical protein